MIGLVFVSFQKGANSARFYRQPSISILPWQMIYVLMEWLTYYDYNLSKTAISFKLGE